MKAKKKIGAVMRSWWATSRTDKSIEELARMINPYVQGWINYYGKFYKTGIHPITGTVKHASEHMDYEEIQAV
ncbi:MAG: hypothetical protein IPJ40_19610 [Saprospirales bacterium]|nr:hypothetical protein [Saprospirales bacterium]